MCSEEALRPGEVRDAQERRIRRLVENKGRRIKEHLKICISRLYCPFCSDWILCGPQIESPRLLFLKKKKVHICSFQRDATKPVDIWQKKGNILEGLTCLKTLLSLGVPSWYNYFA